MIENTNMDRKIIKVVKTKLTEDHDAVETKLTLDFTGRTLDDLYEIAAQAAVIKWQGNARRGKAIPTTATYSVPKPGTRGSAVVDYSAALVKLLGGDKTMILLRKYGTAEAAYTAIKPMLDAMMEDVESEG
jgi:hypothetical protein